MSTIKLITFVKMFYIKLKFQTPNMYFYDRYFYLKLQAHRLPSRPVGKPVRLKHTVDIMFRLQFSRNL